MTFMPVTQRLALSPNMIAVHYQASGKVSHIATLRDMFNQADKGLRSFQKFQHYRLVLKEIGRPVQSFRNVMQLIQVFRDALQGTFSHYPVFISLANG